MDITTTDTSTENTMTWEMNTPREKKALPTKAQAILRKLKTLPTSDTDMRRREMPTDTQDGIK